MAAGADHRYAGLLAEFLHFLFAPAFGRVGDLAAGLNDENCRDCGDAVGIAGGEVVVLVVEQDGERDGELAVEVAGVFGVILGDAVNGQAAGGETFQERKRELAGGAADFEEGDQRRAVGGQAGESGITAVEDGQPELGRAGARCRPAFEARTATPLSAASAGAG